MPLPDDNHANISHQAQYWPPIPSNMMAGITVEDCSEETARMEACIQAALVHALTAAQPITWEKLRIATSSDEDMMTLIETIKEGFPEQRHSLPQCLKEYHAFRHQLSTSDGSIQRSSHHPYSPKEDMPHIATRCPPGHVAHDSQGCGLDFLARHHRGHPHNQSGM